MSKLMVLWQLNFSSKRPKPFHYQSVMLLKSQLLFSSHTWYIEFNKSSRQTNSFTLSTVRDVHRLLTV